ncbi:MAG: PorT family protein [Saprospiraceae bacterium]|mgnify:CR=1 FL=1|nr:PorT family protein [Saprospiraceae bacterium]HRD79652.1 porin family protein [Saprospiraceae bacterium]HRJ13695.1 porin family protein [Saprospiraceae bacterium]
MKTTLQLAAFSIAFCLGITLSAQVSLGFRTGATWSNVQASEGLDALAPDFKTISGFNVAAVAEIAFGNNFSLQPELAFTRKGFGIKEDFNIDLFELPLPVGFRNDTRVNYVELPLLAKYKFGDENAQFYLMAGPSAGYATNGRLLTRAKLLLIDVKVLDTPINLDAVNYERLEVGAVAGAGVNINLGGTKLFFDGRYSHSFTQVYDIPVIEDRVSNRGFSINAGLMFPLGR